VVCAGEVIFAVVHALNARPFESPFTKTVRVIDAVDYELITELNLDRHVVDLSIDKNDLYLAIIEVSSPSPSHHNFLSSSTESNEILVDSFL
jgi:hypothetical protein